MSESSCQHCKSPLPDDTHHDCLLKVMSERGAAIARAERAEARAEQLRMVLADALDGLDEMLPHYLRRIRAALKDDDAKLEAISVETP